MKERDVYIIVETLSSNVYGVNSYVNQVINGLKLGVYTCTFTIVEIASDVKELVYNNSGEVYCLKIPKIIKSVENFNKERFFKHIAFLILTVLRSNVINIFLFNFPQHYFLAKSIKINCLNARILYTVHSFNNIMCLESGKLLEDDVFSYREKYTDFDKMLHISNKIICLSSHVKDIIDKSFLLADDKTALIPNGHEDAIFFISKKKRRDIRRFYNFSDRDKLILYVGRLEETKGLLYLIKAFTDLSKIDRHLKLIIIGGGDFSRYLKIINPQITFTGMIEKAVLYDFYSISDLGILLSFAEQCSYSMIEMLMFGLPIMTTAEPNLLEMLPNYNHDLIIKIRKNENRNLYISVREVSNKIDAFFKGKKLKRKRVSNMNRLHYEKCFNIGIMTKKMNYLINSL